MDLSYMLAQSTICGLYRGAMHALVSSFERRFVAKVDAMLPSDRVGNELKRIFPKVRWNNE